jgi:hypothetical protein
MLDPSRFLIYIREDLQLASQNRFMQRNEEEFVTIGQAAEKNYKL